MPELLHEGGLGGSLRSKNRRVAIEPKTDRYRLRHPDGTWLHNSGKCLTLDQTYRYEGSFNQAVAMKRASDIAAACTLVAVPQRVTARLT